MRQSAKKPLSSRIEGLILPRGNDSLGNQWKVFLGGWNRVNLQFL